MTVSSSSVIAQLRRQAGRIKRAVSSTSAENGRFHGYVEGIQDDGTLRGWVYDRATKKGRVSVGVYAADILLVSAYADTFRADVQNAHGCERECGFSFVITDTMFRTIIESDGRVSVRTMDESEQTLGQVEIVMDISDPNPDENDLSTCARMLSDDLAELAELLDYVPQALREGSASLPAIKQPPFKPHSKMFSTAPTIPEIGETGSPAYLDYVRYRYRMDEKFRVAPGLEAADRYLYWYLTSYRSQEKRRVPLSAEQVDYLNAPIVMGGQEYALSRIMWWRMVGRADLLSGTNLNDRDGYLDVLFWWAHLDCTHMHFEDCLVPDRYADFLRGVHPSRRQDAYPLSYFTDRFFINTPRLHFLKPGTVEGRKTLALCMLLMAARRPDLLRYIPRDIVNRLLAPGQENGPSEFEIFVNALRAETPVPKQEEKSNRDIKAEEPSDDDASTIRMQEPITITRDSYTAALRGIGFDLASYKFMTRDRDGNRFEAAMMPPVDPTAREVDVQLIGPLAKASGLGQATRLSADILRATGLDIRGVDFDLDNPAPEGFSTDTMIEEYGPAKINMIHLNAESIPLAFAYQPDVFSGAYNIGYFFWELDKPAYCHYLGMDMLDEIWVSTDYGVEIYTKDDHGKPVVNVGMCYEDTPDITREDSRAFIERRFQLDKSHFVCLVAFDSFSFVQRKNPVNVLKAFQKAFKGVPEARLIVKTQNRDNVFDTVQVNLWDQVDTIISADPRIVVMNETLSYRDLLRLKAGSDIYVSLHKSEGWGFGMIEAMNLGVPVVCTGYSGNMDFCSDETAWLVDYEEVLLRQEEYIFVRRGSIWAEPSVDSAAKQLRLAYDDPEARKAKAQAAQKHIRTAFSTEAIAERYGSRLRDILKSLTDSK